MRRLPTLPGLIQVPSAVRGLTSLFGMGRGGHPSYKHHQIFWNHLPSSTSGNMLPISFDEFSLYLNQQTDINNTLFDALGTRRQNIIEMKKD
jgi:hypothetical protein